MQALCTCTFQFMTHLQSIMIAIYETEVWHLVLCDDICWTVWSWTAITRICVNCVVTWILYTSERYEWISMNRSWRCKTPLQHLRMNLKFEVEGPHTWQLVRGEIPVEWVIIFGLLNLQNTVQWGECTWLDALKNLSAPRNWLKIFGMYIFQCYSWGQHCWF